MRTHRMPRLVALGALVAMAAWLPTPVARAQYPGTAAGGGNGPGRAPTPAYHGDSRDRDGAPEPGRRHGDEREPDIQQPQARPQPGHRGHHDAPRPVPDRDPGRYSHWQAIPRDTRYGYSRIPGQVRVDLRVGREHEFALEENLATGFAWFARYDDSVCTVRIDHRPARTRWGRRLAGVPGHALVEIEGRRPGATFVELIYARPGAWGRGEPPAMVMQVLVEVEGRGRHHAVLPPAPLPDRRHDGGYGHNH